jgi:hypothetical protein
MALASVPVFILANAMQAVAADRSGYPLWITADQMQARYQDVNSAARRVGLADPLFLIPDIGAPSFRDGFRIIDGLGLSDAQVARNVGDARALGLYLLGERQPDLIRMHFPHDVKSVPLFQMPSLTRDYVEIPAIQDQGSPHAWIRRDDLTARISPGKQVVATGGGVKLLGSTTNGLTPDTSSALDLLWRRDSGPASATKFRLTIRTVGGAAVQSFEDALGYGWLLPADWRSGEVVRAHVPLGPLPPGRYAAEIEILDGSEVVLGHGMQPLAVDVAAAQATVISALQDARDALGAHDWEGVRDACRRAALVGGTQSCADVVERSRAELLAVAEAATRMPRRRRSTNSPTSAVARAAALQSAHLPPVSFRSPTVGRHR